MTLQEFQSLDYEGRIEITKKAACLGKREGGNFTAMLYQLDGFYIEVFHHKKYRYCYVVEAFEDLEKLDPYLEQVAINLTY